MLGPHSMSDQTESDGTPPIPPPDASDTVDATWQEQGQALHLSSFSYQPLPNAQESQQQQQHEMKYCPPQMLHVQQQQQQPPSEFSPATSTTPSMRNSSTTSATADYCEMFNKISESPNLYTCKICGKTVSNRWHHSSIHRPQSNRCPMCQQSFTRKDNMKAHFRLKHGPMNYFELMGGDNGKEFF